MLTPAFLAYVIVISVISISILCRTQTSRWVRLIQGVAMQMVVVIPIATAQLTGFVWKSWSIDTSEAVQVFPLSIFLIWLAGLSSHHLSGSFQNVKHGSLAISVSLECSS